MIRIVQMSKWKLEELHFTPIQHKYRTVKMVENSSLIPENRNYPLL